MQKEFKKDDDLFIPQTKDATEILKKIKEFNKLVDYFKSEKVINILNEQLSTTSNERYLTFDHKGNISGCVSPKKTYIDFHTYGDDRIGKAAIYKEFVRVKSNGKIGSTVDLRRYITPGNNSFNWDIELKQVPDNYKPGTKRKKPY